MSLYYESASIVDRAGEQSSLKTIVFGKKNLKSKPSHVYALIVETVKWSPIISAILEKVDLLRTERKLTPALALLLVHDLLLSKNGIAASKQHPLRLSIERHRSRLSAEFVKARVRSGFATLQHWREAINSRENAVLNWEDSAQDLPLNHPRWVRINTLKTSLEKILRDNFANYAIEQSLIAVMQASPSERVLIKDEHVPNLIAVPQDSDLTRNEAYLNSHIILQDKASCFPAVLLNPQPSDGDILDACAAPGNKTTHLAALMGEALSGSKNLTQHPIIYACERDAARGATLQKMVNSAIELDQNQFQVRYFVGQDFLKLKPHDSRFRRIGAIMLDPSCSGSGIVGRDNSPLVPNYKLVLPSVTSQRIRPQPKLSKGKPTVATDEPKTSRARSLIPHSMEAGPEMDGMETSTTSHERVRSLANFQLSMILHAFQFPFAQKIVYSTCSLYFEENEQVVIQALEAATARGLGWRLCTRAEQVANLRKWQRRGDAEAIESYLRRCKPNLSENLNANAIGEACIRCAKGTDQGTMGFFTVKFIRTERVPLNQSLTSVSNEDDDEWTGFSDDAED